MGPGLAGAGKCPVFHQMISYCLVLIERLVLVSFHNDRTSRLLVTHHSDLQSHEDHWMVAIVHYLTLTAADHYLPGLVADWYLSSAVR